MSDTATEVIVVGGGVIGCAIAYELARRGAGVTLVERGPIGREASWASAGIISLPNRTGMRPERIEIGRRSLERYPGLVAELEEQTGFAIEYRRPGELAVAVDADHAAVERARAVWQRDQGLAVEELAPDEARALEPTLPPTLVAAWYAPGVGSSVYRLTQALAAAAARHGATILPETPVGGVARRGRRVLGVRLADRQLDAETVVLASGAWTRFFGEALGAPLPTVPIKGQLIAFANAPARPARVVAGHGGYVRPRVDGTTLVAATEEDVGFDRRVTGEGVAWLLELTRTLCPTLLQGEVVERWSGLRPGSVTAEPMIGPVPGVDGLWVAAGHFRTGAKEAPATAELVALSLLGGRVDPLLVPFAPQRQADAGRNGMPTVNQPERSVLVTPASNRSMVEKAVASPADVALLDLEDAVAPDQKPMARAEVIRALVELDWHGKPRSYRVNALDTPFFYRDLIDVVEAAGDRVDLVVVPKVDRPEDVYVVATLLRQIEISLGLERPIGLEAQIETALGLSNCEAIASASPRVEAVVFGPGDYAASVRIPSAAIGARDEWDEVYGGQRFHYPMHRLLVAGRAGGTRVVDGPFADFRDPDGFRRSCRTARALGFDGKWCIHPSQIGIANEVFSPNAGELAWARQVVAAREAAERGRRGAAAIDGTMIDAASIRMARVTLDQHQRTGERATNDRERPASDA